MRSAALIPLLASLALPAQAQDPEDVTFVTRLGRDTVAVETVRRAGREISGTLVVFTPSTRVNRYTMQLTEAGTIHAATIELFPGDAAPNAAPEARVTMTRHETRVTLITVRGRQADTLMTEVPGATIPQIGNSMAVYEQMAMQAAKEGGPRVTVHLLPLAGGTDVQQNVVTRLARDTVAVDFFGSPHLLHVDEAGRLLGMDGSQSTFKVMVERVPGAVDLRALAAAGAERDRAGSGLGALSTRDTARAVIGGAEVSVDYGRPAVRGRQILGNVVPFGEVWRTGANNPTMFATSRDLQVGDRTLPAGNYTLLTVPSETGAEVIFSRQPADVPGHDPAYDLARIPAEVLEARTPVERLTITFEPGEGGVSSLVLAWHTFVWRVPVRAR
jgi:hypothetical protein